MAMSYTFAAYSRRFLVTRLKPALPLNVQHSSARGIRVLWFALHMGGGWVSKWDLSNIGAGGWRSIGYALGDLVKDELMEEIQLAKKTGRVGTKYRITDKGKKMLQVVEKHVAEEQEKAEKKLERWRKRAGIE